MILNKRALQKTLDIRFLFLKKIDVSRNVEGVPGKFQF